MLETGGIPCRPPASLSLLPGDCAPVQEPMANAQARINHLRRIPVLWHSLCLTDRLLAEYVEMATDSDREAEAEQWLAAVSVDMPLSTAVKAENRWRSPAAFRRQLRTARQTDLSLQPSA